MPNMPASCCCWSESILASLKRPAYSASSFPAPGPSDLQGPHHGAQKSTSTGTVIEAATTSASKILYGDVDHWQKRVMGALRKGKFALFWPKPTPDVPGTQK